MANERDRYHLETAAELVGRFEALLARFDIKIAPGSVLEAVSLDTYKIWEEYRGQEQFSGPAQARELYIEAMGFHDLMRHVLAVEQHPSFDQLIPHFQMLNKSRFLETASPRLAEEERKRRISQNVPAKSIDDESNKLFELLIAVICMRFSQNVTVDNPYNSKGDNPDVIFEHHGESWAIACKTVHTPRERPSPEALLALIESAVDQIERSNAESGMVCINLKNQIDHSKYWDLGQTTAITGTRVFSSFDEFGQLLAGEIRDFLHERFGHFAPEDISQVFFKKKARPLILAFAQTSGVTQSDETEHIASPTILGLFDIHHFIDFSALRLLTDMNLGMHHMTRKDLGDEPLFWTS